VPPVVPLHREIPTIHRKHRTRDPGRFVAGQINGETCHILRLAQTADGMYLDALATDGFGIGEWLSTPAVSSVSTNEGQMQLTRILSAAWSMAMHLVSSTTAPLEGA